MRRLFLLIAVALLVHAAQAADAQAAVTGGMTCRPWPKGKELHCTFDLEITGTIDRSVAAAVAAKIEEMHKDGRKIHGTMVTIDSPGGNLGAAMEIGRLLRQERLPILVDRRATCASSCVFILAGAVHRAIRGSVIIHRPFLQEIPPGATVEDIRKIFPTLLSLVRDYLREMNIPESFAEEMFAVSPEKQRSLSSAELDRYGLSEIDKAEQEVSELQQASRLGIDRSEFFRRKRRQERLCSGLQGREHIACVRAVMSDEPFYRMLRVRPRGTQ